MLWSGRCNAVPLTEGAPAVGMDHAEEVPVTAMDFSARELILCVTEME